MKIVEVMDGTVLTLGLDSNVKASKVKEEIAKVKPDISFVVIGSDDVASHGAGGTEQFTPKTLEAYLTLLGVMNIHYKVGDRILGADMHRDCDIIELVIGNNETLFISLDTMDNIHYVNHTHGECVPTAVSTDKPSLGHYRDLIQRNCYINDQGKLQNTSSSDFTISVSDVMDFVKNWDSVANGRIGSIKLQMAIVDGKLWVTPLGVTFDQGTYVEEFTLYDPNQSRNSIQVQFDNISMKMLED